VTEQRTAEWATARANEVRCSMGRKTDTPCPFPVAERPHRRFSLEPPRLCAFHAASEPLVQEESDLGIALELLDEWQKRADELDNGPLQHVIVTARQEFGERLALIEGVLEDLHAAEMRLFRR
jgi:hypothetical protein